MAKKSTKISRTRTNKNKIVAGLKKGFSSVFGVFNAIHSSIVRAKKTKATKTKATKTKATKTKAIKPKTRKTKSKK
jgi:hypothetical protein